ncbi:SH3 domain-binding protein 5 homolog [Diachasma alloeum]|uniref:SH3 domain-binding protein 5 homolog n=1 Tax=Diachasma alloeum TaxID=454923 RepID=UPI0007384BB4|nr:SH3 domain-binding protein 5 homolog [Diachasma alloeum]
MEFVSDSGDALDPRIQIELENLNNATEDINKLESELDEAHSVFKQLLSDYGQLREIASKIGPGCIDKARCYYEALEEARRAQVECQYQAQLFQRASEFHAAAKKNAASAEIKCMSSKQEVNFDQTWQDMLNHATTKVMNAANQKAECEKEHLQKALIFVNAERKAQEYEKKYHRAIIKARPYFEARTICDEKLEMQKQQVECLQKAVREAKRNYAKSFRALEEISNQIHEHRRAYANGPREPGVGAELMTPEMSLNYEDELNREILSPEHRTENINNRLVDGSETPQTQWEIEFQTNMKKLHDLPSEKFGSETSIENSNSGSSNAHQCDDSSLNPMSDSCQDLQIKCQNQILTNSPVHPVIENYNLVNNRGASKSLGDIPANVNSDFEAMMKSVQWTSKDY